MTKNKKQTMQFLFGDRELVIKVADLLSAPVDVIVNPEEVEVEFLSRYGDKE